MTAAGGSANTRVANGPRLFSPWRTTGANAWRRRSSRRSFIRKTESRSPALRSSNRRSMLAASPRESSTRSSKVATLHRRAGRISSTASRKSSTPFCFAATSAPSSRRTWSWSTRGPCATPSGRSPASTPPREGTHRRSPPAATRRRTSLSKPSASPSPASDPGRAKGCRWCRFSREPSRSLASHEIDRHRRRPQHVSLDPGAADTDDSSAISQQLDRLSGDVLFSPEEALRRRDEVLKAIGNDRELRSITERLLCGQTPKQVAADLGISLATVYRRIRHLVAAIDATLSIDRKLRNKERS